MLLWTQLFWIQQRLHECPLQGTASRPCFDTTCLVTDFSHHDLSLVQRDSTPNSHCYPGYSYLGVNRHSATSRDNSTGWFFPCTPHSPWHEDDISHDKESSPAEHNPCILLDTEKRYLEFCDAVMKIISSVPIVVMTLLLRSSGRLVFHFWQPLEPRVVPFVSIWQISFAAGDEASEHIQQEVCCHPLHHHASIKWHCLYQLIFNLPGTCTRPLHSQTSINLDSTEAVYNCNDGKVHFSTLVGTCSPQPHIISAVAYQQSSIHQSFTA